MSQSMDKQFKGQVYVSYAWTDERGNDPERAGRVEDFCTQLLATGLEVIRDSTHIAFGDRLSSFLRRIGRGDRVFVFLSESYLKSPYCMFELLTIWLTCDHDEELFRSRTRVYTMPGTDINSIASRLKYATHWKQQRAEIQHAIQENVDVLGPTDLKNFRQIEDIAKNANELLAQINDVIQPRKFDEYIALAIAELHSC